MAISIRMCELRHKTSLGTHRELLMNKYLYIFTGMNFKIALYSQNKIVKNENNFHIFTMVHLIIIYVPPLIRRNMTSFANTFLFCL